MSALPSDLWPPPPPPAGDLTQPFAAVLPPPSVSPSSLSLSPSLLIIGGILLFVILASVSIHLLLRLIAGRRSSTGHLHFSSSARVSSFTGDLHFPPQTQPIDQESSNNKEKNADALIEALPLFTLASSLASLPKSSPDCAVCLSPFDLTAELRLLPACCHAFHSQCIDTWLRSTSSCPLCRASVRLPFPPLPSAAGGVAGRPESFRVEIGSVRRSDDRNPSSASGRSVYSIGSFDYRIEDEIDAVVSRITRLKDEKEAQTTAIVGAPPPPGDDVAQLAGAGDSGRGWLRDYVDRLASSASSSLRFSNRWSARWSSSHHRQESDVITGADVEAAALAEQGEEEEAFYAVYRWIIGV